MFQWDWRRRGFISQTPTLMLIQKIWNKGKQLQGVIGFTEYSPLWGNHSYLWLAKLQQGPRWNAFGATLLSFLELQNRFNLPTTMLYSHLQLRHAVCMQGDVGEWVMSSTSMSFMSSSNSSISVIYCTWVHLHPKKSFIGWVDWQTPGALIPLLSDSQSSNVTRARYMQCSIRCFRRVHL